MVQGHENEYLKWRFLNEILSFCEGGVLETFCFIFKRANYSGEERQTYPSEDSK